MTPYDMIIVGAGISGLSMAHYSVRRGLSVLLLEQDQRIGGALYSHSLADTDFWLELGAHSCFNSYGHLLTILENCQALEQIQKKAGLSFKLLTAEQLASIPSQLHYGELLSSIWRILTLKKAGRSVAEYYSALFGPRNYQAILRPAFSAVICQPADAFPADLLFRPKPRRRAVPRSFSLPHGLQSIAETLAGQPGLTCLTGQAVQSVSFQDAHFAVNTAAGDCFTARYVTLATPANVTARLVAHYSRPLTEMLATIAMADIETLAVALPKEALPLSPLAGIIAADEAFYSAVSRDVMPHPDYRGMTFHFKPGRLDHEAKLGRIAEVLGVQPGQFEQVVGKQNVLPALTVNHGKTVARIDKELAGERLALAGNYFTGVSIEECVARSASEFQRLFPDAKVG